MNLDHSLLSCLESAPEECRSARIRMTLEKAPITHTIKLVAESPRRDFRVSRLVKHKTGTELNRHISPEATELKSALAKELIFHLNQYGRSKRAIKAYALGYAKSYPEEEALIRISQLIYLLDKKKITTLPLEPDTSIPNLFDEHIKKVVARIGGDKDTGLFRSNMAREISKALVTTKGLVNFGLIPLLQKALPGHFPPRSSHLESTLQNLTIFYQEESLRDKLNSIPKPTESNTAGQTLIRISLNLENTKMLQSYHAQRTALMALLSRPRQEHVANCFALSIAISLFSNAIDSCLDDFREILEYGYMKRVVHKKSIHFPALLRQPHTTLMEPLDKQSQKDRIDNVLKATGKSFPENLPLNPTAKDFLEALGDDIFPEAAFIWESDTKNPLTTVWSNILASMAEAKNTGLIKTAIVASAYFAMNKKGASEGDLELLKNRLLERVYLHYDPSIAPFQSGEEAGGFVLYDKNGFKRIDTAKKYQSFLASLEVSHQFSKRFLKESTLASMLSVYEQEGSFLYGSGARLSRLRHTPWITRIGNNPKALMGTYSNRSDEELTEKIFPKTPEDLLSLLVSFARKEMDRKPSLKMARLSTLVPIRIVGEHAFNLILNHPSFLKCVLGDEKKELREMFEHIAPKPNMPLPKETEEKMGAYILSKAPHLSELVHSTPLFATLETYRNHLLTQLSEETVDRKLFQFLPENLKKELDEIAIHFADTNWQINGFDIHLALCYNPFTLQLQIFHAEGRGKLLYPLDMKDQLGEKTWELFSTLRPQLT